MEYLNAHRFTLSSGEEGIVLGTTKEHQHNSNFSVGMLLDTQEYVHFDSACCQNGLIEIHDLASNLVTPALQMVLDSTSCRLFDMGLTKWVGTYTNRNPEADEINDEDLQAAVEIYDKHMNPNHPF